MADLKKKFETAAKDVKKLDEASGRRGHAAAVRACTSRAPTATSAANVPGAFSFVDRAKYDAWAKLKGTESTKAQESYIKLVERLKKTYG